jgi:DNA-binding GntR family transcriptional regulator
MAADNDFPRQLDVAADKLALWDPVKSCSGHIDRLHLPTPGKSQHIVRHHKLIAAAIDAGGAEAAQRHVGKHLSGTLRHLAEIRARFPEYLSD